MKKRQLIICKLLHCNTHYLVFRSRLIDGYISSQKNGIGTYIREPLFCLRSPAYNICLISFNSETEEFDIIECKGHKKLLFPVLKGSFLHNVQVIDKFLRLYIKDDTGNIFFVNHSPSGELLISLRENSPLSKVIFTILDFGWTAPFMGSLEKYKRVVKKGRNVQEQRKASNIFYIYTEEKRMYGSADGVVCISMDTYDILQNVYKINEEKLFNIPNGIRYGDESGMDKDKVKTTLHLNDEDKVLLFIGRPTKQKGIFDLSLAMDRVLVSCPMANMCSSTYKTQQINVFATDRGESHLHQGHTGTQLHTNHRFLRQG